MTHWSWPNRLRSDSRAQEAVALVAASGSVRHNSEPVLWRGSCSQKDRPCILVELYGLLGIR